MTKQTKRYQIPPPWFVRTFAIVLLLLDLAIIWACLANLGSLGWISYVLMAGAIGSLYFTYKALRTGDPVWVLLDLLIR